MYCELQFCFLPLKLEKSIHTGDDTLMHLDMGISECGDALLKNFFLKYKIVKLLVLLLPES